ncbi:MULTISPECIES: TVP38/TMEM64 family protein [Gordonia]|uniref:TVP38/TMEM64 family membrane protein n=1 Tax=Gordonia amicalis TaxID=89053 RepID=A0ABU4DGF2_9ACTN|nr:MULTISPECIES: TVP38/TMEM64 family protein [Gordonia]ATD70863.1 TVP38/TMEM64 family protein [Gordonia sp. 1D]MCZ0913190.1 TVP38/TMEM64 family protein [Gordonia amicalis]MCZ4580245.1 TVP38/TMEM64 family protein [Gordonia amicalis]MCZ4653166.1 TVP38/TMEM64 family protein [Gordonia amicalis]MDJ0451093.1 TVP38/TMEM64 family protein [Gordonia amicalis]
MPEPAPVTEVTPDAAGSRRRVVFDRRVVRRALAAAALVALVLLGSYFIPLPSIGSVRAWGDDLGPAFPWLFFAAYAVVTIAPIPRSTFTVMSGIFFGPVVGFVGAMIASSIAAVAAFGLVRALGRDRVRPFLKKPVVKAVEYRLERRGWLAVGSLRLIAACPFSVANYCSALSSVRPVPFTVASIIGMAPGTAAVVMLGDSLTGDTDPLQLLVSGALFAVGIAGLILDARLPVASDSPQAPRLEKGSSSSLT